MDWEQFGTIVLQVMIVVTLICAVGFFGSAIVAAIYDKIKGK